MIILQSEYVLAKSLEDEVNSGKTILRIGTSIVIGFVTLGVMSTVGGWLLDTFQKQKLKIYMEIAIYLVAMLVPIAFFFLVFAKMKQIASI
jgi:hypothetical protein